jgi:metacaspase-1
LSTALKAIKSARLLIFIDACHSGGAVVLKAHGGSQSFEPGFDEKSLQHLAEGYGRVAISSSRSTEYSLVMPGARNSVFTQHLLEVLKGETGSQGDGFIRVFHVFEHVAKSVPVTTSERQHPIFKASDVETNFPVALEKGGNKAASRVAPSKMAPEFDWEEFGRILSELYPLGPLDQEVWSRAGGDVSRLKLQQSGRTIWFSSLVTLRHGGGGQLTKERLLETALSDFPNHVGLRAFLGRAL